MFLKETDSKAGQLAELEALMAAPGVPPETKRQIMKQKPDEDNVLVLANRAVITAMVAIGSVFIAYVLAFSHLGFSDDQGVWGSFGDFVGGVLNPIIAFLALVLLFQAVKLQKQELAATRQALEDSNQVMRAQHHVLEIQTFEATFFRLLEHLLAVRESIVGRVQVARSTGHTTAATSRETMDIVHSVLISSLSQVAADSAQASERLQHIVNVINRNEKGAMSWTATFVESAAFILRFVDEAPVSTSRKAMYRHLLCDQTSSHEQALVFYYVLGNSYRDVATLRLVFESGLFAKRGNSSSSDHPDLEIAGMILRGELAPSSPSPQNPNGANA